MQKRHILLAVVPIAVSVAMAFYFYGLIYEKKANVEITSIQKETIIYGGQAHQKFTGFVANNGNAGAQNVVVHVSWLDGNNGEHVGSCHIGFLNAGESKQFTIDFSTNTFTMISYYTQWATYE